MNSPQSLENGLKDTKLEKTGAALAAGFVYFASLFTVGLLFEGVAQQWLLPQAGEAAVLASGLTVMLPCAWLMNRFIARRFAIDSPWPQGAIVAGVTMLLLLLADLVFLGLLDTTEAKTMLNHGWIEARFIAQIFMSALPLVFQDR